MPCKEKNRKQVQSKKKVGGSLGRKAIAKNQDPPEGLKKMVWWGGCGGDILGLFRALGTQECGFGLNK